MRKLLLILALAVGMTASAQKQTNYYFFIDLTAPELIEDFKEQAYAKIDKSGLSKDNGCNGIKLTVVPITDVPFLQPAKASIVAGGDECTWYANPMDRKKSVKNFNRSIDKALGKYYYGDGYPLTRIYETVMGEMVEIKNQNAKVFVFSDMFENTDDFSMFSTFPKDIDGTYESIKGLDVTLIQGIANDTETKKADYALMFWTKVFPGAEVERFKL